MATAADNRAIVPPAATTQASYSGTPRGSDGVTTPDDYAPKMANPVTRMEIFEEMGQGDDAVRTALEARRQEISAANWQLSTASTDASAVEILEFIEDNLYPLLDQLLRQLAGALQYGFAALEPVYQWSSTPLVSSVTRGKINRVAKSGTGDRIWLRKLAHLRQTGVETFKIAGPNDPNGLLAGDLQSIRQHVFDGASFRQRDVPASKVLLWVYDKQGDDHWGVPPTRHCYKAWTFKQQIEKISLMHFDKFGVGTPILEEGEGWQVADRDRALALMMNWRSGARNALSFPKGGSLTVETAEGTMSGQMLEYIKLYALAIAKTMLTQLTELGSTDTGTRALGETFADQLSGIVQGDVEDIANLVNNGLVVPLVRWNFGDQEFYPTFAPSQRVRAGSTIATVLNQLKAAGVIHPRPEDEEWARDAYEMPTVDLTTLKQEQSARDIAAATIADAATNAVDEPSDPTDSSASSPSADALPSARTATESDGQPGAAPKPTKTPAPAPKAAAPGASAPQIVQKDVLNGAQIASAKDIVIAVVAGELPRDTGIAMLMAFFNLDRAKAEEIMGAAGTKTPTTPNPVAGAAKIAAHHDHRPQFALADGAPDPATNYETTYRTPAFSAWEYGILRPDVLLRDLDLQSSRVTAEAHDVLRAIDEELVRQVDALASKGAAALSAGVKGIAVPDRLRKQLRAVLLGAAQRARGYGATAVTNEIERQVAPSAIGPQRTPRDFFGAMVARVKHLAVGDDKMPADFHLEAEVDRAVEDEIDRREASARGSALTALAQAAGAIGAVLASVATAAAKGALVGLSTGRTHDNIAGVVNTGFGIGRSETAQEIAGGSGGPNGGGLKDADGNRIGIVAKVYSAVMDLGTCDECAKFDGAEFPTDYPEDYTGVQAPNPRCAGGYARCRCVWIYLTDKETVPLVPASKGPQPIRSAA